MPYVTRIHESWAKWRPLNTRLLFLSRFVCFVFVSLGGLLGGNKTLAFGKLWHWAGLWAQQNNVGSYSVNSIGVPGKKEIFRWRNILKTIQWKAVKSPAVECSELHWLLHPHCMELAESGCGQLCFFRVSVSPWRYLEERNHLLESPSM